jgi:calcium/calmodulin-dependent protein kinase I
MEQGVAEIYEFEEIIGEGAFSNVVRATHNGTQKQYAIKIVDKERIQSTLQRERVDREIAINKACNHPNIVKFVESYESDLEISIVMELMEGGDLFDRILSKGVFSEEEARTAMYNILSALDYLHDRCIVHRDLKPENLLYTTKADSALLKISDFGLSKYATAPEWVEPPCGTIAYIAPEVAGGKVYRKVVDLWSCGCILYFMLFGKPPFYGATEEEIYDLVAEGKYNFPTKPLVSDSVKELISFLLEKDPNKRFTSKQTLAHPWMTGRSVKPRDRLCLSTPPQASMPLSISSLRVSLNSVIDSQRGPLTPPLASPADSTFWKKRASRVRVETPLKLSGVRFEPELSSDPDEELEDATEDEDEDDEEDEDSAVRSGSEEDEMVGDMEMDTEEEAALVFRR